MYLGPVKTDRGPNVHQITILFALLVVLGEIGQTLAESTHTHHAPYLLGLVGCCWDANRGTAAHDAHTDIRTTMNVYWRHRDRMRCRKPIAKLWDWR